MDDKQKQAMTEKYPATFVATARARLQDLASIALYIHAEGEFAGTRSGILNTGIKMLASLTQRKYPVAKLIDAVTILRELGYGDSRRKGTKYYTALTRELDRDELSEKASKDYLPLIDRLKPIVEQKIAEEDNGQKETSDELIDRAVQSGIPLAKEADDELKGARQEIENYNKRVEETGETDGKILDADARIGKKHKADASDLTDIDKKSSNDAKDMRKGLGEVPDNVEEDGD